MKWTSEKEEYLINNWQYLSDDELAETLAPQKVQLELKEDD